MVWLIGNIILQACYHESFYRKYPFSNQNGKVSSSKGLLYMGSCSPNLTCLPLFCIHTVKLKGNLTHTDRAHATYWLKACIIINPYVFGVCGKKHLPKVILKGKNAG